MWTHENRPKYNRDHLRYPSDLTDDEWARVKPFLQPPAILKVAHFLGSQISGEMIHRWDGAFAIPSGWFARGLRDFSGPPEGAERQYRDGGFRSGGLRPVFHAKRVVSVVPAHP